VEGIAHKGVPKSKEHVMRVASSNSKRVAQYDTYGNFIREYCSVHNAAIETGILFGNIAACARGNQKISGGFVWKYIDQESN
jgi:hypothetical protein